MSLKTAAIFSLIAAFAVVPIAVEASHTPFSQSIGVQLSKSCLTMIQNEIKTQCPTYEDLYTLDSTNPEISGGFSNHDGIFQRESSKYQQNWRFYDLEDELLIWVDCAKDSVCTRIRHITIHPTLPQYFTISDMTAIDNVRSYHHTAWVDAKCKNAAISGQYWKELLPQMIFYMRNGCNPDSKLFENYSVVKPELTVHDISTSKKWNHDKWIAEIKENCLKTYGICKDGYP